MIKTINHKGLRLLWEKGNPSKLPPKKLKTIKMILLVIDSAVNSPDSFAAYKNWRIHPLKGNLKGFWSLDVSGNWRIIFRFENGDAFDLNFVDTH